MLLIKPSLWARVGVGAPRPLDRSRVCYPHGVRRFRSHNERRVTSTNPVGQPQASHHQHLQAVQCCQHAWSSFSSFRDSGQRLFRGNYLDAPLCGRTSCSRAGISLADAVAFSIFAGFSPVQFVWMACFVGLALYIFSFGRFRSSV